MRRVLASASPRRKEILQTLGLSFEVVPSRVDEAALELAIDTGAPGVLARALAEAKARDVAERERGYVLGADTIVVVDGAVLNKPEDDDDAASMLRRLGGRWHDVVTGVALVWDAGAESLSVSTRVLFRALSEERIERYVATGEGRDKAGSYAVQGIGAGLVTRIEGSWSNVVGLPAAETVDLLERSGALDGWP